MMVEMFTKKPVFGFNFGKPLRSMSLEMLGWADGEWKRDGWIGAHNSYLHILYRSGIIGMCLIGTIVVVFIRMTIQFFKVKSLKGILLCAIVLNWMIAANFLLILELPYTAIPIWTIFGLTYGYYQRSKYKVSPKVYENIARSQ